MIYIITTIAITAALSFWLPYRQGKKHIAFSISILLTLILGAILIPLEGMVFYILLFPIVLFALIFIIYWAFVNFGFRKAGKITTIVFAVVASLPLLHYAFEDYFFFKSDAKEFLKDNNIVLLDKFSIRSNKITGQRDLNQKFELEISNADRTRIIEQIRKSRYFSDSVDKDYLMQKEMGSGLTKRVYKDYEQAAYVCRQSYEKLKQGYKADHDIITVEKTTSILTFERINE